MCRYDSLLQRTDLPYAIVCFPPLTHRTSAQFLDPPSQASGSQRKPFLDDNAEHSSRKSGMGLSRATRALDRRSSGVGHDDGSGRHELRVDMQGAASRLKRLQGRRWDGQEFGQSSSGNI